MSPHRLRLRRPILLSIIAGLLAAADCAAQPSTTDLAAAASPACRTVRVPVTVPNLTTPAQLTGDLCTPAPATTAVLLLVGGGGENADYWNLPGLAGNSLVDAATRQGYATLAVDRLGTGRSTLPPSSTLVSYPA